MYKRQILQSGEIPENTTLPDGAIIGIGSDRFGALITALSANSKSNLLSTPSLLTLDNQEAEILVGQNVPFKTSSYVPPSEGSQTPVTNFTQMCIRDKLWRNGREESLVLESAGQYLLPVTQADAPKAQPASTYLRPVAEQP